LSLRDDKNADLARCYLRLVWGELYDVNLRYAGRGWSELKYVFGELAPFSDETRLPDGRYLLDCAPMIMCLSDFGRVNTLDRMADCLSKAAELLNEPA